MKLAVVSQKRGVPVDLHYQFDEAVKNGRPVTLHLAAVPRVEGTNLVVSIKEDPGVLAAASPLLAPKASAATAYRQNLPVTKLGNAATELRVLVTMDTPEGPAFSWFGVPLVEAPPADKQEPVNRR